MGTVMTPVIGWPAMRALICDDYTGIDGLRIGELEDPKPGPGSVLVEVTAATVNFADVLMVKGDYQIRPEPPFAPGYELAGTVLESNDAASLSPGDRVAGFTFHGALAEKAVVQQQNVARLPDAISFDVGSTLPGGYGTSYHGLVDRARLKQGETLLVLGASGGVGLSAVQIGHALGARVIAAVSSEEKARAVRDSGADEVIRYDQVGIRDGIKDLTGGVGVDVVYDPVGGDITEEVLRSTAWNGRLLVVGFAAGGIPRIPLNLPLLKGNAIVGVFWGRFTQEEPEKHQENFATIVDWAETGRITPLIQKTYALDDGAEALRWIEGRNAIGRVVVRP
jgi:NADPH:quinone reductase